MHEVMLANQAVQASGQPLITALRQVPLEGANATKFLLSSAPPHSMPCSVRSLLGMRECQQDAFWQSKMGVATIGILVAVAALCACCAVAFALTCVVRKRDRMCRHEATSALLRTCDHSAASLQKRGAGSGSAQTTTGSKSTTVSVLAQSDQLEAASESSQRRNSSRTPRSSAQAKAAYHTRNTQRGNAANMCRTHAAAVPAQQPAHGPPVQLCDSPAEQLHSSASEADTHDASPFQPGMPPLSPAPMTPGFAHGQLASPRVDSVVLYDTPVKRQHLKGETAPIASAPIASVCSHASRQASAADAVRQASHSASLQLGDTGARSGQLQARTAGWQGSQHHTPRGTQAAPDGRPPHSRQMALDTRTPHSVHMMQGHSQRSMLSHANLEPYWALPAILQCPPGQLGPGWLPPSRAMQCTALPSSGAGLQHMQAHHAHGFQLPGSLHRQAVAPSQDIHVPLRQSRGSSGKSSGISQRGLQTAHQAPLSY